MARLSVVMIVKNEQLSIAECLQSVSWADEIIVLDAGSEDDTRKIAQAHGAQVHVAADWPGYGVQRQRAQAKATGDWIFMLDADERVTPALVGEIRSVIPRDRQDRAYALPRLSWVFGRFIRHGGWYPDYVVRLYPREKGHYNDAKVHEKVVLAEGVQVHRLSGDLLHFTYRDMNHYLVKSADYAKAWAAERERQGRHASLLQASMHGLGCFMKMYLLKLGCLDGRQGLLLALLSAHSTFVKYADLWVRHQKSRPQPDRVHEDGSTCSWK